MIKREGQSPTVDLERLTKIVRDSTTSVLPPTGFRPLQASPEELKKLGFPKRPDPELQPVEYAFWQEMFAPPVEFEAFDFEILPLFKSGAAAHFSSNCRGGKPASIGLVPTSRRGMARYFRRSGENFRFRRQISRPEAGPARSITAPRGSVSMGSVGTTARPSRRSARRRISTPARASRQSHSSRGGNGG